MSTLTVAPDFCEGNGPIYLADISCTGRQSSLLDCQYYPDEIGNVEIILLPFQWRRNRSGTLACTVLVGALAAYFFGEGSGPVHGGICCRGTESSLTQCSSGSIG